MELPVLAIAIKRLVKTMELNHNFFAKQAWFSRATIIAILAGSIAACNDTTNNPNTATPTPTKTVVVTPTPIPTQTVVVTPSPIPTQTVVVTPSPIPTQTVVVTPSPIPAQTVIVREPITDLAIVGTTPDKQLLLNKRVEVTNIKAQTVNGDRTFWVGAGNNQQLFVVLDPVLDAGSAENKVVVKPGQALNLTGVIKPMPSSQQAQTQWGLSAAEAQQLSNQTIYLQADRIKFL